jgi:hypothetical protein
MAHSAPSSVPVDRSYVALRLAAAERLLTEAVARLPDGDPGSGAVAHRTREVDRAAARVRYWRELQRGAPTHPSLRVCRMLGHSWVATGLDPTSMKVCKRCGTAQN